MSHLAAGAPEDEDIPVLILLEWGSTLFVVGTELIPGDLTGAGDLLLLRRSHHHSGCRWLGLEHLLIHDLVA